MAFSLDDLRNIVQGTPTAETMLHAQQAHAIATHNLPPAALEHASSTRPERLYEQGGPVDAEQTMNSMESMLAARLAKKASQPAREAAPAALLQEASPAAPVATPAYYTPPAGGYPAPGIPAAPGIQAGRFGPAQGGVPLDFLNRVTGQSLPIGPPAHVLQESYQNQPQSAVQSATPSAVTSPEALRSLVREVIMTEVLNNEVLAPMIEQLVKANLRTIVREELTRLQRQGQQQTRRA